MNPLWKDTLYNWQNDGLQVELGEDWPDLEALYRLSVKATQGDPSAAMRSFLEPRRKVGGITLRRLSIGSEAYLNENVIPWFARDDYWRTLGICYCMAVSEDTEALWEIGANKSEFLNAVSRWRKGIKLSFRQLETELDAFLNGPEAFRVEQPPEEKKEEKGPGDYGFLVGFLTMHQGHDPHYWTWVASIEEVSDAVNSAIAKIASENPAGVNKGSLPELLAFREFKRKEKAFRERKGVKADA